MVSARRSPLAGAAPASPRRKWRAITYATLLLAPAYWSLLAGVVSVASDAADAPPPGPYIAFGLCLVPFVFVVLAFLSENPRAPGAVVKAMILTLLVGIPVSAVATDAVTGFVAGVGAGGVVAMRSEPGGSWRIRALAVFAVSAWALVTARVVPEAVLLLGPVLPFTSIGVADHLHELRRERAARG